MYPNSTVYTDAKTYDDPHDDSAQFATELPTASSYGSEPDAEPPAHQMFDIAFDHSVLRRKHNDSSGDQPTLVTFVIEFVGLPPDLLACVLTV